jgi:hypothetical protein
MDYPLAILMCLLLLFSLQIICCTLSKDMSISNMGVMIWVMISAVISSAVALLFIVLTDEGHVLRTFIWIINNHNTI